MVCAADVGDREAATRVLEPCTTQDVPRLDLLWADQGVRGDPFATWLTDHLGCAIDMLTQPWMERPGTWVGTRGTMTWPRDRHTSTGFQVVPTRWIVERSLAWMTRWRRFSRDHEGFPASSEACLTLSAIQRMLSLVTRSTC